VKRKIIKCWVWLICTRHRRRS